MSWENKIEVGKILQPGQSGSSPESRYHSERKKLKTDHKFTVWPGCLRIGQEEFPAWWQECPFLKPFSSLRLSLWLLNAVYLTLTFLLSIPWLWFLPCAHSASEIPWRRMTTEWPTKKSSFAFFSFPCQISFQFPPYLFWCFIYLYVCIHSFIYVFRERGGEGERERGIQIDSVLSV